MFTEVFEALTERLGEAGYTVVLGLSGYGESREDELLAAVLSRKPDAVFMIGVSHSAETRQRLQAANIRVVESWDLTPTPIEKIIDIGFEIVKRESS
jgi:LacI family transcriptional regulator, gluconate utilization system Gnt-I transcriptional repressor